MKLPRWLVIGMLNTSVLSVLAAAGWWWVTWPERTAQEFFALYREGEFGQARQMLAQPDPDVFRVDELVYNEGKRAYWRDLHIKGMRRTWLDRVVARQTFFFFKGEDLLPAIGFEAERGKVSPRSFDWP